MSTAAKAKLKEPIVWCPPSGRCLSQVARRNAVPLFLLCGTMAVILGKALYQLHSTGRNGVVHKFEKPWLVDCTMFVGMTICLVGFFAERFVDRRRGVTPEPVSPKLYWAIAIPALCDAISTFLMNVGLLWVMGSVWQMLRGSIILFTALLKIFYRKSKLYAFEWTGLFTVIVALSVVGATSFFTDNGAVAESSSSSSSSSSDGGETPVTPLKLAIGISLVVFAQLLQALQTIIEEKLLHDVQAPATLIVGMEGLWGFLICAGITMPIAQFLPGKDGEGIHEDTLDSFIMIGNSPVIIGILAAYLFFILLFNLYGMVITELTDAMMRNIMEPLRVAFIWVTGLFVHYVISDQIGEKLSWWSFMELGGFVVLSVGFFLYNRVIRLPCFFYPPAAEEEEGEKPKETEPLLAGTDPDTPSTGTIQQQV